MKIKFNNKVMQRMIEFKVKVKEVPNGKVTAEYEIFKGQPNYYNPLVGFNIKDNTAKKILEYVAATLGTSLTFTLNSIIRCITLLLNLIFIIYTFK